MQEVKLPKYKKIKWIHQTELPNKRLTPGKWPPRFKEYGLTKVDFNKKREWLFNNPAAFPKDFVIEKNNF